MITHIAKRTPLVVSVDSKNAAGIPVAILRREGSDGWTRVAENVTPEDAEYIRKAWNMHEELAAFAQDAAKWFVMRPGGTGNLEARAATLLSRCQE